ncbi:hypothetical protein QEZ40_001871 [Streptomyces katrae]|uniref:Serine/threonine protein kinase n=1 Tax=Streptomyces katrae TaxID=68223 RepID=A0ABT7GUA9_9ACTN|nr:hypothetical protein [Streptomyces katrae]MDK9497216.1 hypothetical protein [Streptomyces katrae]
MPRTPRYLLIWLSCTAASVTAVLATVQFVVGSTGHKPPAARSAPVVIDTPPAWQAGSPGPEQASPTASPSPSPSPSVTQQPSSAPPSPSPVPAKASTEAPLTGAPRPGVDCERGGAGLHTVPSQGGKVTVRYGSRGVCLISAVPGLGFRTTTSQASDDTLTVTFSSDGHRSEITATITPSAKASVRESSF